MVLPVLDQDRSYEIDMVAFSNCALYKRVSFLFACNTREVLGKYDVDASFLKL